MIPTQNINITTSQSQKAKIQSINISKFQIKQVVKTEDKILN